LPERAKSLGALQSEKLIAVRRVQNHVILIVRHCRHQIAEAVPNPRRRKIGGGFDDKARWINGSSEHPLKWKSHKKNPVWRLDMAGEVRQSVRELTAKFPLPY
jgi:hypothetical protein